MRPVTARPARPRRPRRPPDVVLLDIRMPRRTGLEACAAIKAAVPAAKIIMLTVSDEEADLYDAVKAGASGYLLKDSSVEESSRRFGWSPTASP